MSKILEASHYCSRTWLKLQLLCLGFSCQIFNKIQQKSTPHLLRLQKLPIHFNERSTIFWQTFGPRRVPFLFLHEETVWRAWTKWISKHSAKFWGFASTGVEQCKLAGQKLVFDPISMLSRLWILYFIIMLSKSSWNRNQQKHNRASEDFVACSIRMFLFKRVFNPESIFWANM